MLEVDYLLVLPYRRIPAGPRRRFKCNNLKMSNKAQIIPIALGNGIIMLSSPTEDYQSPGHHRLVCEVANKWLQVLSHSRRQPTIIFLTHMNNL